MLISLETRISAGKSRVGGARHQSWYYQITDNSDNSKKRHALEGLPFLSTYSTSTKVSLLLSFSFSLLSKSMLLHLSSFPNHLFLRPSCNFVSKVHVISSVVTGCVRGGWHVMYLPLALVPFFPNWLHIFFVLVRDLSSLFHLSIFLSSPTACSRPFRASGSRSFSSFSLYLPPHFLLFQVPALPLELLRLPGSKIRT